MKTRYLFVSLLLLATGAVPAQEAFDLLRNSSQDIYGTARAVSMANAFGALGGDITGISINPAGIGIYRSAEVSYSQLVSDDRNLADFYGTSSSAKSVRTMPSAFGFVESYNSNSTGGIANFNWGITYNRTKNFHSNTIVQGYDREVSLLDNINVTDETLNQGVNLPYMAYNAYLFNKTSSGNYESILQEGQLVNNELYQAESGYTQAWDFSFGLNYDYKLYFGLTVRVQTLRYNNETTYYEDLGAPYYKLTNQLQTRGTGVGVNLGLIYRPVPEFRIGLAYHSPIFYSLTDYAYTKLYSAGVYDDDGILSNHTVSTDYSSYGYKMETPHQVIASLAYQLGLKGFISTDFQISTTNTIKMSDQYGKPYTDVNHDVQDFFQTQCQARVGFEWRFSDLFNARLGYAHTFASVQSVVEDQYYKVYTPSVTPHYTIPQTGNHFAAGFGFRFGHSVTLDFAGMDKVFTNHVYPYYNGSALGDDNCATVKNRTFTFVATLGFHF